MKKNSLSILRRNAWDLMSEWSRRNAADDLGRCQCVSCSAFLPWQEMDAGHFIHAGHGGKQNPVSYDDRNIHPQCRTCNRQSGSKHKHPTMVTIRYTQWMIEHYGPGIVDQLEAIKKQPWFRWSELEEKIELYKARLRVMDKAKKWGGVPRETNVRAA